MPVCTEDLDKANSRSHGNIRWCGGNKCGTKREHCKLYSKERHTDGLADRLDGKSLLFQLLPGIWSRWATNDIYLVPKCFLFQWIFSPAGRRVDYDWANVHYFYRLFHAEKSWHALIFWGLFLVGIIRSYSPLACSRRSDSRAREKNSRRKIHEEKFTVYNLTRSPLTAALYYLNACNRLIRPLSESRTFSLSSFKT